MVMPFRLKNTRVTYQRAMKFIFDDLSGKFLEIYIDDVAIKLDEFDDHLDHLQQVFLKDEDLSINDESLEMYFWGFC